ncbi:crotonobetaine/carnitine-CoA ligase [Salsuginibacillus halophilus]|uniref:Crotonobetaine/carnitine-CoA ligase n=1 Tax=Salsuginibacillus halophilus TaxID=517424 RepID=A0A2P8HWJ3_9BACI|nr:AMP-binding protein [Salsuginibacillus halophilus]PSL50590.1 crotonobetaine/carnitine-CoA ligase [Salsuginibacillus halophilus]
MDILGNETLIDVLHEKCRMHGEKVFLLFEDNSGSKLKYTYNEFLERVNRLSHVLLGFGVKKGDRVTLHLPNSSEFLVSWFAIANIGAVMVPTNVLATSNEMDYVIEHSESVLLITEEEYLEKFETSKVALERLKGILLTRVVTSTHENVSVDNLIAQASSKNPNISLSAKDVVAILYTSGTTSKPKGCLITHTNYLYTGEAVAKSVRFSPEDRSLIVLPLFHGNGQYYLFMPALVIGGSVAITERFSATQYVQQAKRLKATIGSLFAAPIRMILAQTKDLTEQENLLRFIFFAQSVAPEELKAFEERLDTKLLQLYGMTETVAPPLMNPLDRRIDNTSIGKPLLGSEVKLLDQQGEEVSVGQPGQIAVRGEPGRTMMKGYLKNHEATNVTIQNGWLLTGDKATMNEQGYFYFVDRQKDMIKRAGENIAASEVENIIMEHGDVYEASVVGVPDPVRDETIKAYIILKENRSLTPDALITHCRKTMAKFKVPDHIEFVEDFPRTSVGKIQKNKLREGF